MITFASSEFTPEPPNWAGAIASDTRYLKYQTPHSEARGFPSYRFVTNHFSHIQRVISEAVNTLGVTDQTIHRVSPWPAPKGCIAITWAIGCDLKPFHPNPTSHHFAIKGTFGRTVCYYYRINSGRRTEYRCNCVMGSIYVNSTYANANDCNTYLPQFTTFTAASPQTYRCAAHTRLTSELTQRKPFASHHKDDIFAGKDGLSLVLDHVNYQQAEKIYDGDLMAWGEVIDRVPRAWKPKLTDVIMEISNLFADKLHRSL